MSRYRLDIADEADDAELRRLLYEHPMPGMISLALCREPSFFDAACVDGRERQIFVGRDSETGRIIGTGSRSLLHRYVNGEPTPIGYLGGLRLAEPYRNRGLIARAFAQLRRFHQDGKTKLYLTTIATDNVHAIATLTSQRAGLPRYIPAGSFHTAVLPIARNLHVPRSVSGYELRHAAPGDIAQLIEFLNAEGRRRQFFPRYEVGDFSASRGLLRGLRLQDILLAFERGRIVGSFGLWNQQAFRQQIVSSYGQPLRAMLPFQRAFSSVFRRAPLPAPGEVLRSLFAAIVVIQGDNSAVFGALLQEAITRAGLESADYLLIGLHERDPLLPSLRQQCANWYVTNLYLVCWEDGEVLRQSLDDRPPYLELGSL